MTERGVVLFHTTSSALRAEKVLGRAGVRGKLIPTPREMSSDCGIALEFDWAQHTTVERLLEEAGVEIARVEARI